MTIVQQEDDEDVACCCELREQSVLFKWCTIRPRFSVYSWSENDQIHFFYDCCVYFKHDNGIEVMSFLVMLSSVDSKCY